MVRKTLSTWMPFGEWVTLAASRSSSRIRGRRPAATNNLSTTISSPVLVVLCNGGQGGHISSNLGRGIGAFTYVSAGFSLQCSVLGLNVQPDHALLRHGRCSATHNMSDAFLGEDLGHDFATVLILLRQNSAGDDSDLASQPLICLRNRSEKT